MMKKLFATLAPTIAAAAWRNRSKIISAFRDWRSDDPVTDGPAPATV